MIVQEGRREKERKEPGDEEPVYIVDGKDKVWVSSGDPSQIAKRRRVALKRTWRKLDDSV